jgi:asparagine synthase (glutamine-hydrolysing)
MSAIFGWIGLDGRPQNEVERQLEKMKRSLGLWGPDGVFTIAKENAGMGQARLSITPESVHDQVPSISSTKDILFTASARLDNRDELLNIFAIPASNHPKTPDTKLVELAYLRWGKDTCEHIFGDWAFAAWHPETKELFLARDPFGNTALHYYKNESVFIFSSDLHAILDLDDVDIQLNEVYLASQLISFVSRENRNQTYWKNVFNLHPGDALTLSGSDLNVFTYWSYEAIPEIRYSSHSDYVEGFLDQMSRAVKVRLRSNRPIGTTLSAGLDSTTVTALAATKLGKKNVKLPAFTSVPKHNATRLVPDKITDEWDVAHTLTVKYPNIQHIRINASDVPIHQGILRLAEEYGSPTNRGVNLNWILSILLQSREMGLGVLLTGQMGNAIISWYGGSNKVFFDLVNGKIGTAMDSLNAEKKRRGRSWPFLIAKHFLAPVLLPLWNRREFLYISRNKLLKGNSIIHPEFCDHIGLKRIVQRSEDFQYFKAPKRPENQRAYLVDLNKPLASGSWHRHGAMHQLEVRDPTADVQLVKYCFGIPNELYTKDGLDRAFLRNAMKDILTDEIRLNKRRGRQAADFPLRIIQHKDEILALIKEFEKSPVASRYLNFDKILRSIQALEQGQRPAEMRFHARNTLSGLSFACFLDRYFD